MSTPWSLRPLWAWKPERALAPLSSDHPCTAGPLGRRERPWKARNVRFQLSPPPGKQGTCWLGFEQPWKRFWTCPEEPRAGLVADAVLLEGGGRLPVRVHVAWEVGL